MKFDKQEMMNMALETAKLKSCIFINELVSYLPCSRSTFYELFPAGSDTLNTLKEMMDKNAEQKKSAMYRKWFESSNPSLQIALMKLLATPEQAHRLNGTSQKIEHSGSVNISPKEWV